MFWVLRLQNGKVTVTMLLGDCDVEIGSRELRVPH